MSQTGYSQLATARPIQTLIIKADDTFEVRVLPQDIRTWQELVGGYAEAFPTGHCTFWFDEEGKLKDQPRNTLATFLWWNLCPEVAERDVLQGTVFVTGPADEVGDSLPVDDTVVELFEGIVQIYREEGDV